MEVHKKLENGKSETHFICDGCGLEIDRRHMRNSAENRESKQLNIYDNFGNVSHYCRRCSGVILKELQAKLEEAILFGNKRRGELGITCETAYGRRLMVKNSLNGSNKLLKSLPIFKNKSGQKPQKKWAKCKKI